MAREKELTRQRDEVLAAVRRLPWIAIEKPYTFQTEAGPRSLVDLFAGKSQLVVYHFMFGSSSSKPCPSCSFWADHFAGLPYHLPQRDTAFKVISRAPLEAIREWKQRLGWTFDWVSSEGSEFNFDFGVSDREKGESPGLSVFYREGQDVYQTYFTTGRGLESLNGTYSLLDIVPKGRDEDQLEWPAAWVKRHDEYPK